MAGTPNIESLSPPPGRRLRGIPAGESPTRPGGGGRTGGRHSLREWNIPVGQARLARAPGGSGQGGAVGRTRAGPPRERATKDRQTSRHVETTSRGPGRGPPEFVFRLGYTVHRQAGSPI